MKSYKYLWISFAVIMAVVFTVLGYYGVEIYRKAPPIPDAFVSQNGEVVYSREDINAGQSAWLSIGGMSVGSVWGHGAYQAPDWTADWLHRSLLAWLDEESQTQFGVPYAELGETDQHSLKFELKSTYRQNTYDGTSGEVTLTDQRIAAIRNTAAYYERLFGDDPEFQGTRESYAMKENTLPSAEKRTQLAGFFFWSAWAASTERPGLDMTYTNNWPHEPLIDNVPTPENIMWSIASIVLLLFGIGMVIWFWAFYGDHDPEVPTAPEKDPLSLITLTSSQRALGKYLFVVVALFCFQILMGAVTAHYTVEGQHFYGVNLSEIFPYSLTRTWHLQSAIFWIATSFLAAGLFLVPIVNGGKDPAYQKLGVDILFIASLVVVGGSFFGELSAINGWVPDQLSFWIGHQGYEYVELGRVWQIGLYIGLLLWLFLMMRGVWTALCGPGDKSLLILLTLSVGTIGLFYGMALMYGEHTNLSIMEYWRWWVVHLWVEGFFEVFATVAIAFVFFNMGLVGLRSATVASILAATLFLIGGVPGTFHHLYFSGTTTPVMAFGAMFSALEVVPLVILGHEGYQHWSKQSSAPWMIKLKWPILFFVAVAFWNMLGAGVFGFLINPPISLFYVQGLNTTANHAHAALFGVYGFLALGFVLLILRYLKPHMEFNNTLMKVGFWSLNIGLGMMLAITLLPVGALQAYASISKGLWYARSEAFMQQDVIQTLLWLRTAGDIVFMTGTFAVAAQVVAGLWGKTKPAGYVTTEKVVEEG